MKAFMLPASPANTRYAKRCVDRLRNQSSAAISLKNFSKGFIFGTENSQR